MSRPRRQVYSLCMGAVLLAGGAAVLLVMGTGGVLPGERKSRPLVSAMTFARAQWQAEPGRFVRTAGPTAPQREALSDEKLAFTDPEQIDAMIGAWGASRDQEVWLRGAVEMVALARERRDEEVTHRWNLWRDGMKKLPSQELLQNLSAGAERLIPWLSGVKLDDGSPPLRLVTAVLADGLLADATRGSVQRRMLELLPAVESQVQSAPPELRERIEISLAAARVAWDFRGYSAGTADGLVSGIAQMYVDYLKEVPPARRHDVELETVFRLTMEAPPEGALNFILSRATTLNPADDEITAVAKRVFPSPGSAGLLDRLISASGSPGRDALLARAATLETLWAEPDSSAFNRPYLVTYPGLVNYITDDRLRALVQGTLEHGAPAGKSPARIRPPAP